ncbi:MAG: hypothetical protein WC288_02140 [Candidatus Paceibacterota bacterium]|jgi:hypothetical protein|nr:hypothetical protein [Candidatus Paceibacterota bacterium]
MQVLRKFYGVKGSYLFSLPSKSAQDFFKKLESVASFKIKAVQTDNGLEFEKYFRGHLRREG